MPGHVLVCPRAHLRSVAAAPDDVVQDLEALALETTAFLRRALGRLVHAFEHGSGACTSRVACSIEHAHLHLIPADVDVWAELDLMADWRPLAPGAAPLREASAGLEYLAYTSPRGERWLATTADGFPSQMLRQVFARALGREDEWNWRTRPARPLVEATVELFADAAVLAEA